MSGLHAADAGSAHIGYVFRDWLDDIPRQRAQREALESGRYIGVAAGMPDHVIGYGPAYLHVSLSCRPLVIRSVIGRMRAGSHHTGAPP
ncbi:hypothetical protein LZF96_10090 [Streptomyces sp. ST2-7A]|nr:hypothetical protein [Streptomyces sp. ST2-7A]